MSGLASALELSAKIVRENLADLATARRLLAEKRQEVAAEAKACRGRGEPNQYLENMERGYAAALGAMYEIAQRGSA